MDQEARRLIEQGDKLFTKRQPFISLLGEIASHFYPERNSFIAGVTLGEDFASNLTTSYPLLARRDLGNSFSGMLRPTQKDWFKMSAGETNDVEGRSWLEWATQVQKRAMYDRRTQFVRATKEGDHDFAAFGQCVISVEMNRDLDGLVYRCWHIADVAWCEDEDGAIDTVHRRWKPTIATLNRVFRGKIAPTLQEKLKQDPYAEINCRHVIVPAEQYQGEKKWRTKFVSLYIDVDNQFVMEAVGAHVMSYVIPRWQTVSGSQYAYSPATICALPDARLIQAITLTLLEAGEKAANPPMLAVQEAVRSDMALYAGGVTWVDAAYDERLGEVLRPLTQDKSGIPYGIEMRNDTREMIKEAFFINKLNLPSYDGGQMTAYEVGQRVQEYIRQALPIFEPLETDYNGGLCEATFDLMFRHGAFGPVDNIPKSLSGAEIKFRFESPLSEAVDKQKGGIFLESAQMLAQAVTLDPNSAAVVDAPSALRDVLQGIGMPAKWMRSEEQVQALVEQAAQAAQAQQLLATMGQGAQVGKTIAETQALSA